MMIVHICIVYVLYSDRTYCFKGFKIEASNQNARAYRFIIQMANNEKSSYLLER